MPEQPGRRAHLGVVEVPDATAGTAWRPCTSPSGRFRRNWSSLTSTAACMEVARGEAAAFKLLREVDGLAHVVRAFDNESVPHAAGKHRPQARHRKRRVGADTLRSCALIEKRDWSGLKSRLEKKYETPELEREQQASWAPARDSLEKQTPLREVELDEGHPSASRADSCCPERQAHAFRRESGG